MRAWANATFVPELSAAELEALRARADAATDPQERMRLARLYAPPSETNFGGGLLSGTQSACDAACAAFREAVAEVARAPR